MKLQFESNSSLAYLAKSGPVIVRRNGCVITSCCITLKNHKVVKTEWVKLKKGDVVTLG